MKAGWLSLKALWKPFKKRVNRNNTKFCDKIAYVWGPSFRRRPWPFGERCSRARATSATLVAIGQSKSFQGQIVFFDPSLIFYNLPSKIFMTTTMTTNDISTWQFDEKNCDEYEMQLFCSLFAALCYFVLCAEHILSIFSCLGQCFHVCIVLR